MTEITLKVVFEIQGSCTEEQQYGLIVIIPEQRHLQHLLLHLHQISSLLHVVLMK